MSLGKDFLQMMVDTPPPCTDEDPELFFAGHDTQQNERNVRIAKAVCRDCPLIFACHEFALETNDQFAILGGKTPNERSKAQERYNLRKEKQEFQRLEGLAA
jgi:WhiB family redox-sensing transcriptional regulator